jgi:hypothetical protein
MRTGHYKCKRDEGFVLDSKFLVESERFRNGAEKKKSFFIFLDRGGSIITDADKLTEDIINLLFSGRVSCKVGPIEKDKKSFEIFANFEGHDIANLDETVGIFLQRGVSIPSTYVQFPIKIDSGRIIIPTMYPADVPSSKSGKTLPPVLPPPSRHPHP